MAKGKMQYYKVQQNYEYISKYDICVRVNGIWLSLINPCIDNWIIVEILQLSQTHCGSPYKLVLDSKKWFARVIARGHLQLPSIHFLRNILSSPTVSQVSFVWNHPDHIKVTDGLLMGYCDNISIWSTISNVNYNLYS